MNGYVKLFGSILTSTIWQEDLATRVVWITMLALKDEHGVVEATVPGLAHFAGVTVEETERALSKFLAPDKYSRTKDCEGRRVEAIDGGWILINHAKYRERMSSEHVKEQARIRAKRYRDRKRDASRDDSDESRKSLHTDTDTDSKAKAESIKQKKQHPPAHSAVVGELAGRLSISGARNLRALQEVLSEEVARSSETEAEAAGRMLRSWQYYKYFNESKTFEFESVIAFLNSGAWASYSKKAEEMICVSPEYLERRGVGGVHSS